MRAVALVFAALALVCVSSSGGALLSLILLGLGAPLRSPPRRRPTATTPTNLTLTHHTHHHHPHHPHHTHGTSTISSTSHNSCPPPHTTHLRCCYTSLPSICTDDMSLPEDSEHFMDYVVALVDEYAPVKEGRGSATAQPLTLNTLLLHHRYPPAALPTHRKPHPCRASTCEG